MRYILIYFFYTLHFGTLAHSEPPTPTIHITSPKPHETVRNNTQILNLSIESHVKHIAMWSVRLNGTQIYLDAEIPEQLYPIYRGTHSLVVEGLDNSGKVIAVSNQIIFYKHQARIR